MCTILAFALGSFLGGSFGIVMAEDYHNLLTASEDIDRALREYQAKEEQLSAEAEPTMTEEVREALMRLTMCAREECGMCKYKDECGFDFQYKISTDNMNTLADALLRSKCEVDAKSAEAVQGWIPCSERLPEIDETLRICDQISEDVLGTDTYGNIRHVYLTNCGYLKPTFCTVEEGMSVDIVAWMPLPKPYKGGEDTTGESL